MAWIAVGAANIRGCVNVAPWSLAVFSTVKVALHLPLTCLFFLLENFFSFFFFFFSSPTPLSFPLLFIFLLQLENICEKNIICNPVSYR